MSLEYLVGGRWPGDQVISDVVGVVDRCQTRGLPGARGLKSLFRGGRFGGALPIRSLRESDKA